MMSHDARTFPESRVASRPKRRLFITLCALLLAGIFAGSQLSTWPARIQYPGEQGGIEGMRLAEMLHLRRGVPIYAPATAQRFDAAIYGPLYYLLGSRVIDPGQPAYLPLRLLAALGTLGCAAASGWLAFRVSGRPLAGILAPLIFLSYAWVSFFGTSSRADSLALMLVSFGVVVAHRFRESTKILWAIPFFLLAFFYKQQFIAAPLAVFLFLALARRYRVAAAFAGLMAAGLAGFLALFQFVIFRGQGFFLHFVRYNVVSFTWTQYRSGLIVFAMFLLVPLLVGLECVRDRREKFLACYLVAAVAASLLSVGKTGGDTIYFLECIFVMSALFAALLSLRIAVPGRAAELLALLVVTLFVGRFFAPRPPDSSDFAADLAVQDYLRRNFAPHTRALGFYAGDLVRAGLDTPISDVFQYTLLIRKGTLPERDLVAALERRDFKLIILMFDLPAGKDPGCMSLTLTEGMARAMIENYRLDASLELPGPEKYHFEDRFYAWVPRSSGPATVGDSSP